MSFRVKAVDLPLLALQSTLQLLLYPVQGAIFLVRDYGHACQSMAFFIKIRIMVIKTMVNVGRRWRVGHRGCVQKWVRISKAYTSLHNLEARGAAL